jgi:hypothetical protein
MGWLGLLQLFAELREWDDPEVQEMAANLHPLEQAVLGTAAGSFTVSRGSRRDAGVLPSPEFARWHRTLLPKIFLARGHLS